MVAIVIRRTLSSEQSVREVNMEMQVIAQIRLKEIGKKKLFLRRTGRI